MLDFFLNLPLSPELVSALLASLPVTELRAALPVALLVFHLSPATAYVSTVLGNLIPIPLVFLLLPMVMKLIYTHIPKLDLFLNKRFDALKNKHGEDYSKWGSFFLFLFVAIPLPGTGVWTGSVLAVLFGIKPRSAILNIVAGLLTAGLLVLAITQGVFQGIILL